MTTDSTVERDERPTSRSEPAARRSLRQTTAGRVVYVGMILVGLVFVSTLALPVVDTVARTVATVAFGLMSGLWLATVLYEVGRRSAAPGSTGVNWTGLAKLYSLIAAVSAVSVFVFVGQFTGTALSVLVGAVGAIAVVSAILGAVIAGGTYLGSDTPTVGAGSTGTVDPDAPRTSPEAVGEITD